MQLQKTTEKADKPLSVSTIAEQYVQLSLSLGEHEKGYIDAYYGPDKWQQDAQSLGLSLKEIITKASQLQHHLSFHFNERHNLTEVEQLRLHYLKAQLKALSARAQMNTGEIVFTFDEETQALFDTQAPTKQWSEFEDALSKLEDLLPGGNSLIDRVDAFRADFVIPTDKLKPVFEAAIQECRARTKKFIKLPDNENFTLEFVQDKPWSGYNWYKGNSYSLIQVNTELPINISRAIDLGCHEGYPGHHTYNGLLEENLYRQRGWVEFSVYPLFSPQSLIAEGSANYGIEMAFPEQEKVKFEQEVLFPMAGLDTSKAALYSEVSALTSQLSYAGNEVARRYLNGEIQRENAEALLQKYALMSPKKAQQRVRFMDTYGSYVINYNWGKDLVKQWVEADGNQGQAQRWQRFSELLSTPRLPSTLD
ncbi:MAG: hypothetical protein HWE10_15720 [Gammaproteobacteria bacterium]|nr:hypothetical protein [Gammaproteobacteria bacterium]